MTVERTTLTISSASDGGALPDSDAARTGGDFGVPVSQANLKAGFIPASPETPNDFENYETPAKEGFLPRQNGWDR